MPGAVAAGQGEDLSQVRDRELATRAIEQAKSEKKAAYFVSTGGVNNTNWTTVLTALAKCGTLDYYKQLVQEYFIKNKIPLQAIMSWYDLQGHDVAKGAVINGDPEWRRVVQGWTAEMNTTIRAALPADKANVRFMPAPALDKDHIQKIGLGGCPHPNEPGHVALAQALNQAFG